MQFYLDGYRVGDPAVLPAAPQAMSAAENLPAEVDVLIVGCGPGRPRARCTARGVSADQDTHRRPQARPARARPGRRHRLPHGRDVQRLRIRRAPAQGGVLGQRDGVLEARSGGPSRIVRSGRIQDTEDGLSELPHVIVQPGTGARLPARGHARVRHQARAALQPRTPRTSRFVDSGDYPVTVTLQRMDADGAGTEETIRARYVVGCDGARSSVRQSIGRSLVGDVANQAWGVMDVLAVTDFPDIRLKSAIHSAERRKHPHHPARGRLPRPLLHRARQARTRPAPDDQGHHARPPDRRGEPHHSSATRSRSRTSPGGRCTRSASGCATKFDDVPAAGDGVALSARLHRRRRLPHA